MKENKSFWPEIGIILVPPGVICVDENHLRGYNTLNGLSGRREQKREASQEKPKEAETSPGQFVPCSISTGSCSEKNRNGRTATKEASKGICRNIKELVV
jgi:hypothetical protein